MVVETSRLRSKPLNECYLPHAAAIQKTTTPREQTGANQLRALRRRSRRPSTNPTNDDRKPNNKPASGSDRETGSFVQRGHRGEHRTRGVQSQWQGKSAKGKYRKSTNKRLALCPANPTINYRECKYDVGAENNLITSNCSALCFMFNLDLTV